MLDSIDYEGVIAGREPALLRTKQRPRTPHSLTGWGALPKEDGYEGPNRFRREPRAGCVGDGETCRRGHSGPL
jgi:hypothetical protein